ncbi:hypothetical protein VTJ49DRAFT_1649 [Mycothermus thermophilus]|uniref:Uncharacterized protein n=1 Tax=Humicola insolens TaxID=85995 RepID=A0ABR3VD45_HUMIN
MKDIHSFEGEPPKPTTDIEMKPPKRPSKVPIDDPAGTDARPPLPPKDSKKSYSQALSEDLIDMRDPADKMILDTATSGPRHPSGDEVSFKDRVEAARTGTAKLTKSTVEVAPPAEYSDSETEGGELSDDEKYQDPQQDQQHHQQQQQEQQQEQQQQQPIDKEAELERLFRSEMQQMEEKLKDARIEKMRMEEAMVEAQNRAEQAERAAEEIRLRYTAEAKAAAAAAAADAANSGDDGAVMRAEIKRLQAELDEARSHIFSLQPYLKDLTPKEVAQDFDDLVNSVSDWVTGFMDPILDDEDRIDDVLLRVRRGAQDVQRLRRYMHTHPDLVYGCTYPETDVDIMIALVLRYLQDHVFQQALYGAVPQLVQVISFLEASMQTNVQPKRDQYAMRTWRAETLNAAIHSPDYHQAKYARARDLTSELGSLFKVFRRDKEDYQHMLRNLHDNVIMPALRMHEKLMTSTHHFYLDLTTYMIWASRSQEFEPNPDFWRDVAQLRCENILQNRKPFNQSKLDPQPSMEDLFRDLVPVATVVPALKMRQVGKGDVIKEPTPVRQQQVLVAWGSVEKREKFREKGDRTLLNHIYYTPRERQERVQEGGGVSTVLWAFRGWA